MEPSLLGSIAQRHGIELMLQFGSTVAGHEHAQSDVDLGVLFTRAPDSYDEIGRVTGALQAAFPGKKIDLAVINRADPLFLRRITEQCVLLYGTQARLHDLKIYAFKRYQDHRRFLSLERDYVRRQVEAHGS